MPYRPGGLDPADINAAFTALGRAASAADLEKAIAAQPTLRSPVFHGMVRQEYLRLVNANSPQLAGFLPRYDGLFSLLHERQHVAMVGRAREAAQHSASEHAMAGSATPSQAPPPFRPPYFDALARLLGDALPTDHGPVLDPQADAAALGDELAALLGHALQPPAYELLAGTRWCALAVQCAVCSQRRFEVRAYAIDLVVAPELAMPLIEGRINASRCPRCGSEVVFPRRVWVAEAPGPGDALAALSCALRLGPWAYTHQPPPGTRREPEYDRVLEIRFDALRRRASWPGVEEPADAAAARAIVMSVAYTPAELQAMYHDAVSASPAEAGGGEQVLPRAMRALIDELQSKISAGAIPLHQALQWAFDAARQAGQDWPLKHPGIARLWQGPPLVHLMLCRIAEGLIEARGEGAAHRAIFAANTASSLLAIGELGLAEAALARAEDAAAQIAPGREHDLARAMVDDVRADWLEAAGRFDEAGMLRARLQSIPELQGDALAAALARQGLAAQQALALYEEGRMAEALSAFQDTVPGWQALAQRARDEAAAAGPDHAEAAASLERACLQGLSGDLANLASVLTTLLDDLAVVCIARDPALTDDERRRRLLAANPDPAAAVARIEACFGALEVLLGAEFTRAQLAARIDQLLRQALQLAEQSAAWEFAGVQAHRLAGLHATHGDPALAEQFAQQAVRHAARAGDHERVWTALALLADRALARGDGAAALKHLEVCARHYMRHEIGLGGQAHLLRATLSIGVGALRAAACGGDTLRAIMVVESLRAAATAAQIVTGAPEQLARADGDGSAAIAPLRRQREQLETELLWAPDDETAGRELTRVKAELSDARRSAALRDPHYGRLVDASDIDLAAPRALQTALGTGALWLGALVADGRVWSWSVGLAGGAVAETALAPALVTSLDTPDAGAAAWTPPSLEAAAAALLQPHAVAIGLLATDDLLIVSVSGPLQSLPLAALPWQGGCLCERVSLVMAQGYGIFEAACQRPVPPWQRFALAGGPARPDVESLPGATAEVRAIAQQLREAGREVTLATGAKATVQCLVDVAAGADVLHLACHALAQPDASGSSRLLLAPDLLRGDSGDLSEGEVLGLLTLKPGVLVNLAGCSTGCTRELRASALGGLVPAFLVAGARSVVATLWPIADAPAAAFQQAFYAHLVGGARPAHALARTQRAAARGQLGEALRDASVWSAFGLYGAG